MRLRRRETVSRPVFPQTRRFAARFSGMIICAVLAALSAVPPVPPTRTAGRATAGAQIITGLELIAYSGQTAARPIR